MTKTWTGVFATLGLLAGSAATAAVPANAPAPARDDLKLVVDAQAAQVMRQYGVPGMAVAVVEGGLVRVFNYGVASTQTRVPVAGDTLFEIGSVSKTFAATLAAYAQGEGRLSLADPAAKHLPWLQGTPLGNVPLTELATHTSGLPLQLPAKVTDERGFENYLRAFRPPFVPGTRRQYSNSGIAVLGLAAAASLGTDYATAVQTRMLPALGLRHTWMEVPASEMARYAQGYAKTGAPIRMTPSPVSPEAYGIRTTAADMARYLQIQMGLVPVDSQWHTAVALTHTGFYAAGTFTQDLVWEQYPCPVGFAALHAGCAQRMALESSPATALNPPMRPRADVLVNKTGATGGFSTYVAFLPASKVGVVILANRAGISGAARVDAACAILRSLAPEAFAAK